MTVFPSPAGALHPGARVWNEDGGLFDAGRTFGQIVLDSWPEGRFGGSLGCETTRLERTGATFHVSATVGPAEAVELCERLQNVPLGVLAVGNYRLEASFLRPDGMLIEQRTVAFEVRQRAIVCNVSPEHHLLDLLFADPDTSAFVQRFETDAAFRASLADIRIHAPRVVNGIGVISAEFDPLADPNRVLAALRASGEFLLVRAYPPTGCGFATCPGDLVRDAIEFFHAAHERYFFTDNPAEIDALDRGAPHAGWSRTGETFRVIHSYGAATPIEGRVQKAYRFWNASVSGKPSHFFTLDQRECAVLRDRPSWNWTFEGTPFWAFVPQDGACPVGVPLYRVYNNGLDGAPSHRYSTRLAVVDDMVAQGWVLEGVAMCVAGP